MFLLSNKALIRVGEGVKEKPSGPMSDGCVESYGTRRAAQRWLSKASREWYQDLSFFLHE